MSVELVMPSNRLILCRPLLLLPSIFPSIKVFSKESELPWCPFNTAFLGSPHKPGACSCPPAEGSAPNVRPGQPECLSLEQRKLDCGAEPEEQAALLWKPRLPSRLQGAVLWAG